VLASLSRARQTRDLAELVGEDALSVTDRSYLSFADVLQRQLLDQRSDEARTLSDTLGRAWQTLTTLPRRELALLSEQMLRAHLDDPGTAP